MRENKERAVNFLLDDEGSELKHDRDSTTKWGITARQLSRWYGRGVDKYDQSKLTREEARQFHVFQWDTAVLDAYPAGLDYFVFDSSTVCGYDVVLRWLELASNNGPLHLDYDGMVEVVRGWTPTRVSIAIDQLTLSRRRRHRSQPRWGEFQSVWTNRVTRVQKRALNMVKELEYAG
jgi:lysozyme family protein